MYWRRERVACDEDAFGVNVTRQRCCICLQSGPVYNNSHSLPSRMATTNSPPAVGDELDDILSGIAAEGGYSPSQPPANSRPAATTDNGGAGLGIDEEIVVTKKRIPIPKLDDVRLRSEPGIPRLRKISKERLRFKGKGHEVHANLPLTVGTR